MTDEVVADPITLGTGHEIALPGGVELAYPKACLVAPDGTFLAAGHLRGGERTALVSVRTDRPTLVVELPEPEPEFFGSTGPTLFLLPDGALAVVADHRTLHRYDVELRFEGSLPINGGDVLEPFGRHGQLPRPRASASRGTLDGQHPVVLDEPITVGNPRFLALLQVGEDDAEWTRVTTIGPDAVPGDRFGHDGLNAAMPAKPAIVGDVLGQGDRLLLCLEGSDSGSVPRYGMDFFLIASLDTEGEVTRRFERSGWMRQPGKHGLRGSFTSSDRYAVLTPVFSSGSWKGRQHLFELAERTLHPVQLARGSGGLRIIDHDATGYWLSDGSTRLVRVAG
ncbi:MAG: hypothetical protein QM804_14545 [Propionicimonas sp.]